MMTMRLSQAAQSLGITLTGDDGVLKGVSTDTRTLQQNALFVALRGPHFDGHDFVHDAQARGAAGAMVSRRIDTSLPLLRVSDTHASLGQLAAIWRGHFDIPVLAVTGSNGKTTVKEMLAAILGQGHAVLATQGNLNNDIGVPLTLLRLGPRYQAAVIEMGANHAGEIEYLSNIARPTVALITNAAPAHLAGFGSLQGVAQAKGEIFRGLAPEGTAIINVDDPFYPLWRRLAEGYRCISFGLHTAADVSARVMAQQPSHEAMLTPIELCAEAGQVDIQLPFVGQHNVMNALAASAAAMAVGATLEDIKQGLETMAAVRGRLQSVPGPEGVRIIDDSYNANPSSLVAALAVLGAAEGIRILVLGDMAELGDDAQTFHQQAGEQARAAGVDQLFGLGEHCRLAALSFGDHGHHFLDHDELLAALDGVLHSYKGQAVTVLVKGSRAMAMEKIVAGLIRK